MKTDFECVLMSWDEAYGYAKDVAGKVLSSGYAPDAIVGITRGGWVPSMMLSDLLDVRDLLSLRVEHWGKTGEKDKKAVLKHPLKSDLKGKKVLLVDDLTDSGDSMRIALEDVKKHDPEEVRTATLLHKSQSKYKPDYYALEAGAWKWIILPWNLREDLVSLTSKATAGKEMPLEEIRKKLKQRFGLEVKTDDLKGALRL